MIASAAGRHDIPATAPVMNTLPHEPNTESNDDRAERLRRYKAGRVIEFLSTCLEFEDLQENNFLEMNFTDLTEFYVMQLGYESLEECYERFVYREPYGLASLNAGIDRGLRSFRHVPL